MPVTRDEAFLGRVVRSGTWQELGAGTYRVIRDSLGEGDWAKAAELLPVTLLEAEELHDVYGSWPEQIRDWLLGRGVDAAFVADGCRRVLTVAGYDDKSDFQQGWQTYVAATGAALALVEAHDPGAAAAVEAARQSWLQTHDRAVDHVYGMLDVAVRALGEDCLPEVWDHLMGDWYHEHARRLSPQHQPWQESARQLAIAITDGFHGHLSGTERLGDLAVIEEEDRIGFRFDPCGSGGRVLRDDSDGGARPEDPYEFHVTERPHDWAFGKVGVCAYCVHCCLLNMTQPTDRLGHPTRVIEPPTWPEARHGGTCTWWVYRDPALIPDDVYRSIGRTPPPREGPSAP